MSPFLDFYEDYHVNITSTDDVFQRNPNFLLVTLQRPKITADLTRTYDATGIPQHVVKYTSILQTTEVTVITLTVFVARRALV